MKIRLHLLFMSGFNHGTLTPNKVKYAKCEKDAQNEKRSN